MAEPKVNKEDVIEALKKLLEDTEEGKEIHIFGPESIKVLQFYIEHQDDFRAYIVNRDKNEKIIEMLADAHQQNKKVLEALRWLKDTSERFGVIGRFFSRFLLWIISSITTWLLLQDQIKAFFANISKFLGGP